MREKSIRLTKGITLAVALAAFIVPAAFAAGTPEDKCEAGKNDAAGRYAACIGKATKAFVISADAIKYSSALAKCEGKIVGGWGKLEADAASDGATCPSSGDEPEIVDFLDACSQSVLVAVGGGTLGPDPVTCASDLVTCGADISTCNSDLFGCSGDLATAESDLAAVTSVLSTCQGDLSGCTATTARILKTGQNTCFDDSGSSIPCAGSGRDGELQKGNAFSYTDNGDGTVTDNVTGLMWEKLSDDGSIHDKDTTFTGVVGALGKATTLNTGNFAGHNDWRVPNLRELGSLPSYGTAVPAVRPPFNNGCSAGCTVLTCSCTKSNIYVTSTVYLQYTPAVWKINFQDGDIYAGNATDAHYVRLVRTAY